ncbi:MAG: D-alanyl-D-alanine carboxypeptidase [Rhodospirillaceae bacterium]|nr:MAG: D-alanyl-D-alanine carboxypeptidase [Rhodospirillaceae bacterium]
MTFPLRRIAVGISWLAVSILFLGASLAPSPADAQTNAKSVKRAAPPAKARAKTAVRTTSSSWVGNPAVTAKDSYLIVDANSGRELAADRADELRHPASLTKLMTIYLTFSALDSGRLSLGDSLTVSVNALNAPPTKMGMTPGGTVNVRDATMALVTRSANDAAVLLAESLAGSEEAFARLMTQKARQLGMSSTVFRNASGLPNSEQVTTARDLAKLANALMRDYPHYYAIFSVQSYTYRGRTLQNHNRMLGSYDGADGLKTGYTNASGFNLVMSAVRDNRRLIGVVMGGTSAAQRDRTMAALMDRGFTLASAMQLSPWTSVRKPASARYTAAQFDPGASFAEAYRPPAAVQAQQGQQQQVSPKYAGFVAPAPAKPATTAAFAAAPAAAPPVASDMPALGSWVIQVGSFSEPQAAQAALERATAALPNARSASAIVDEVQMANRIFHRARLINLSQEQAVEGCKRLEKRKVYCSALQVTAWNTPGAR